MADEKEPKPDFSNSAYLFPRINREGVRFGLLAAVLLGAVLAALGAFGLCMLAAALALPFALAVYGVFMFFRDPDRWPPEDEKAILSPADGKVCLVERRVLPDSLADGVERWRVSVFMSVLDVHVNRMPTAGRIVRREYVPGKFINASLDKASSDNERCNYLIEAPGGQVYGVTQIAGLVARRIVPQAGEGDVLGRAERFGLIRFGSRLDVYLPVGVEPEVRVGQTMVAGETILAHFA